MSVRRELAADDEYIAELVRAYPCIVQIWLFGSRANGTSTPHSDWDYLVFSSDDRLLNLLSQDLRFNRPQMDLFVVTDGICFMGPWPDKEGFNKKGYLDATAAGWQWKKISETEARYVERVARDPSKPHDWRTDAQERKALRVYPRPAT